MGHGINEIKTRGSIKHREVYEMIYANIATGKYGPGQQLPTEIEFSKFFNTSRPTVGRALRDLERKGIIDRKRGSGTFVRKFASARDKTFGILFHSFVVKNQGIRPNLDTTFGAILPEMSNAASDNDYTLIFNALPQGSGEELASNAKNACEKLIDLQVSGVLFMPFDLPPGLLHVNAEIADRLTNAGITVVLIDRDICGPTQRSKYDIVAIDHEKAMFMLTLYMIDLGWRKLDFISYSFSGTMAQRLTGYKNALKYANLPEENSRIHIFEEVTNYDLVRKIITELDTEAVICVNDDVAILFINQMRNLGIRVPEDIRIVGFDDSPALTHFNIPLTTVRQPVGALGAEAVRALITRKKYPDEPVRTIYVGTEIIVRDSCGAKMLGKK